jgi:hypothetical protein
MRRTSLLAVLLLVVGLLAGCGSNDSSDAADKSAGGPPTNASVPDFCGAFLDLIQQAQQAGTDISDKDAVKLAKDLAAKLEDVGTPSDMPADARRAFETAINKINSLPDDASKKEMEQAASDLTEDQQKDQEALGTYITSKCMGQLNSSSSPSPSPS